MEIEGFEFLFRELSRLEYKRVLRYFDMKEEQEEYICKTCVIEPGDFNFEDCPAGIPTSLAEIILAESGFGADTGKLATYLQKYRNEMTTFDNQVSCIIQEAFPDKSIEDIEGWPMEKTIWYLSRAEYILNGLRGMNIQYTPVEQAAEPEQRPQRPHPVEQAPDPSKPRVTKIQHDMTEGNGYDSNTTDFSELKEIELFMRGKLDFSDTGV